MSCLVASAQSNPEFVAFEIKADSLYKIPLYSLGTTPTHVNAQHPAIDSLSFEESGGGYEMQIRFDEGFAGETELEIEYSAIGDIPGIPYPFYTSMQFRVYPSEVTTQNDVIILNAGSGVIYPLYNDSSSDGEVQLAHIAYSDNCTAVLNDSVSIDVIIDDTSKEAYITYLAVDDLGTTNEGLIVLISDDSDSDQDLSLHNKDYIDIFLSSTYHVSSEPANGVVTEVFNNCWRYTPQADYVGEDVMSFTLDGNTVTVNANVYDQSLNVQFVRDDEVYVAPGASVIFNVLDNDLLDYLPIVEYSNELNDLGGGSFEYTPNSNFSGDEVFYYKVFNGFLFIEGTIVIHVDHFSPNVHGVEYSLQTGYQSELSIVHHTPLVDYSITLVTPPSLGSVTIVDEQYIGECDSTSILNSIVYDPSGNAGSDFFEVEYCTTDAYCEIVKISVTNYQNNTETCACLSDCIWEGDVNQDGIVNSLDIMELAFNVGESGTTRVSTGTWSAQETEDWNYYQSGTERDLVHSDTNGDGFVDQDDFDAVHHNYGKLHDLLPQQSYNLLSTPVILTPNESDVDSGDMVIFYIELGDAANPVLDFSGLSFNFSIDADLIDSSSVYLKFYDESWAGYGKPTKSYFNQSEAGSIDVAISHIGGGGSTGTGIIAELGFIVEDEVGGLRLSDDFFTFPVTFSQGVMLDSKGNKYSLPNAYSESTLRISNEENDDLINQEELSITITPNPTQNKAKVVSNQTIEYAEIYSIDGRLQDIQIQIENNEAYLDMTDLLTSTYLVSMIVEGEVIVEKVIKY